MPRISKVWPALLLAACQVQNPVFMVGTAGDADGTSSGAPQTSTSGPGTTSAGPTSETGPLPVTSSEPAMTTTTTSPDTEATAAVDPSTTSGTTGGESTSTGAGESTSTGEGSTSTGEGSTSAGESSTGESSTGAEECDYGDVVYQKLYPLCDAPGTTWTGGAGGDSYPVTCGSKALPAQALVHEQVLAGPFDLEFCEVYELAPEPKVGGYVKGVFTDLTLAPNQGMDAEFFTAVLCVESEANGTCNVQATAYVSFPGMQMVLPVSKQVANLGTAALIIPIYMIPGLSEGQAFNLHLTLSVNGQADMMDRAYFIAPRIRKKGG
jgi:hypothetical protein